MWCVSIWLGSGIITSDRGKSGETHSLCNKKNDLYKKELRESRKRGAGSDFRCQEVSPASLAKKIYIRNEPQTVIHHTRSQNWNTDISRSTTAEMGIDAVRANIGIVYRKGYNMGSADALSRLQLTEQVKQSDSGEDVLQFTMTRELQVTATYVATATRKNPIL